MNSGGNKEQHHRRIAATSKLPVTCEANEGIYYEYTCSNGKRNTRGNGRKYTMGLKDSIYGQIGMYGRRQAFMMRARNLRMSFRGRRPVSFQHQPTCRLGLGAY